MRLPLILSRYLGRHFFFATLSALGVMLGVAAMIDLVELIRRTSVKENVPFRAVLEMTALKLPYMAEQVLPYAVLIGGMLALTRFVRGQELIAVRASGVSVWQFLAPSLLVALLIGAFSLTVINPLAAAMISRYELLEGRYISGRSSLITVSSSGLWLRQVDAGEGRVLGRQVGEYILHAQRISQSDYAMSGVTIFTYARGDAFIGRIDAQSARLAIGYWELSNATVSAPGRRPEKHAAYRLPTDLKITEIQDSFAEPRTLSFWQLSGFIDTLQKSGFSALRHRIYWHAALSGPLLLCGMVLAGALFSLRLPRRGYIGVLLAAGMLAGFLINFLMNVFYAFGNSGSLPVLLAAWSPPAIILMAGTALLLHVEDG